MQTIQESLPSGWDFMKRPIVFVDVIVDVNAVSLAVVE